MKKIYSLIFILFTSALCHLTSYGNKKTRSGQNVLRSNFPMD